MSRINSLTKSFNYAVDGYKEAFTNEPNFRIHIIVAIFVILLGILLQISKIEWIIMFGTISAVIVLELINTSIEKVVDLASPKFHPKAKIAKDVSAAAVLTSAIASVAIGLIIFFPKIWPFFLFFLQIPKY